MRHAHRRLRTLKPPCSARPWRAQASGRARPPQTVPKRYQNVAKTCPSRAHPVASELVQMAERGACRTGVGQVPYTCPTPCWEMASIPTNHAEQHGRDGMPHTTLDISIRRMPDGILAANATLDSNASAAPSTS